MKYWWVNQNETYRQERQGGYMWCPKKTKKAKGYAKSHHYDNLLRVALGEIVVSGLPSPVTRRDGHIPPSPRTNRGTPKEIPTNSHVRLTRTTSAKGFWFILDSG